MECLFEKMLKKLEGPVEFDLPCWLKKWKPMQYINIKRSIHMTQNFELLG